jgi:hypothetical protein
LIRQRAKTRCCASASRRYGGKWDNISTLVKVLKVVVGVLKVFRPSFGRFLGGACFLFAAAEKKERKISLFMVKDKKERRRETGRETGREGKENRPHKDMIFAVLMDHEFSPPFCMIGILVAKLKSMSTHEPQEF